MNNSVIYEAGAITFRKSGGVYEFLIVKSKKDPSVWIFPKGHIEAGETAETAATRELLEEAGVSGEIIGRAGAIEFQNRGNLYNVVYFIHKYISTENEGEPGRTPSWYPIKETLELIRFSETRKLIETSFKTITYTDKKGKRL